MGKGGRPDGLGHDGQDDVLLSASLKAAAALSDADTTTWRNGASLWVRRV